MEQRNPQALIVHNKGEPLVWASLRHVNEQRAEHLTLDQRSALEAELAELEGPRRREIVEAIKRAREFGDISENFEYHAAKNEQGLLERRIHVLKDRLHHAVTVEHKTNEKRGRRVDRGAGGRGG